MPKLYRPPRRRVNGVTVLLEPCFLALDHRGLFDRKADEMQARARHQGGEPLHEFERRHDDVAGAIAIRRLQLEHHLRRLTDARLSVRVL